MRNSVQPAINVPLPQSTRPDGVPEFTCSAIAACGFGASSIDLLVSAYLRTADMTRFLQMQNDLNLDLMDVMQKNGVDFAFPSTTVYLEKNN